MGGLPPLRRRPGLGRHRHGCRRALAARSTAPPGMHDIYIGDEAVVDVQDFSLAGGHMKGLRQAYNRIAKYGYTASFHDPARLDRSTAERLAGLMSQSRRGEFERGLLHGPRADLRPARRRPHPVRGLRAPTATPAAMCQFVPARGIGGYSLDLMRRDRGEHPNGLIDFALVSTIEHLRTLGLPGPQPQLRRPAVGPRRASGATGLTQRVERWALKKMSSFLQIETLWRFNAKYEPRVAAPLRRVRHRRAPRSRRGRHPAGRVPVGGAGHRAHDRGLRSPLPRGGTVARSHAPAARGRRWCRDRSVRDTSRPRSPRARTAHVETGVTARTRRKSEPKPTLPAVRFAII